MSYYERRPARHLDGTPIFKTAADEEAEAHVARLVEAAWGCRLNSYGLLAAIDWWAERDGRIVGVLELKARSHPSDRYPTVFLNHRKYTALRRSELDTGVPSIFVVRFTDRVLFAFVRDIDARNLRIGGTREQVKSRNDREPVIEVPVASMRALQAPEGKAA
jgi:hypothetical protein